MDIIKKNMEKETIKRKYNEFVASDHVLNGGLVFEDELKGL